MNKINKIALVALACVTMLASAPTVTGQTVRWIGTTGNWTAGSNWDIDGINYPDVTFDGLAEINNGGTAQVTGVVGQQSPSITLGDGVGNSGTLHISGVTSSLVVAASGGSTGDVVVGANGGTGMLLINNGSLQADGQLSLSTSATAASSVMLSGSANVSVGSAFLDQTLRIEGSGVQFSSAGNVILGQAGTHTWQIPATGASTLNVGGQLDLGGTLRIEFATAPTVNTTWDLADSASVINGFFNIDSSTVPGIGNGEKFAVQTVAGGTNGQLTQLVLEQHPVLTVNRQTGAVKIKNFGAGDSIDLDAYAITSNLNPFDVMSWDSLESNSVGNWVEANPTANALSELEPIGSSFIAGGNEFDLGTPFQLPTPAAFGDQTEDLVFRYAKPGGGFIEGEVRYEGTPNSTFVLNVDPTTGQTNLWNPTSFTESIDAYVVSSPTGSLQFANGTWNSLDDQNADDGSWAEANPSAFQVSELQAIGSTTLSPGTSFDLGSLFDINGERDLIFEFALDSENFLRQGIVTYGSFVTTPSGDFNGDQMWDCTDIDMLVAAVAASSTDLAFDMNGDGAITAADITDAGLGWLAVGGANNPGDTGGNAFIVGDANLDGFVNGQDFVTWNSNKFTTQAAWCSGDFNADGFVNGQDFVLWNSNKFTSSQDGLAAVPEPQVAGAWLIAIGLLAWRTRHGSCT